MLYLENQQPTALLQYMPKVETVNYLGNKPGKLQAIRMTRAQRSLVQEIMKNA
jgi:hypothetical protein